jgi:hypothetical protein
MYRRAGWLITLLACSLPGFCQTTKTERHGSGFPRVLASLKLWDQTGGINRTLFTPRHFGVYRISGVVVRTAGEDNSYVDGYLGWFDGGGPESAVFGTNSVNEYQIGPVVFRDLNGEPITIRTLTEDGTIKYNLFLVLEQIM